MCVHWELIHFVKPTFLDQKVLVRSAVSVALMSRKYTLYGLCCVLATSATGGAFGVHRPNWYPSFITPFISGSQETQRNGHPIC